MTNDRIHAFERTAYNVDTNEARHTLFLGEPYPPTFRQWLRTQCRTHCAWIVTGHNPGATRLDAAANDQRHAALAVCLNIGAYRYAPAINTPMDGGWPAEPGFLLLNADEGMARTLARRFGQLAIVAVPVNGVASLVWLDA